jgi:hypothetical protein
VFCTPKDNYGIMDRCVQESERPVDRKPSSVPSQNRWSMKWKRNSLDAIRATVKSGRLELDAPPGWPDGTQVLIEPATTGPVIGIDESQWRDDPDSLADWDAWIKTIEPFGLTSEEQARIDEFDQQMRLYNVDAVERQMLERNDV